MPLKLHKTYREIPSFSLTANLPLQFTREENTANISIAHIPAHIGIVGNEAADRLAKFGTVSNELIDWGKFWNDLEDNFR